MINANELRIGNWGFDLEYFQITSIDEKGVNRNNDFVLCDGTKISSYRCTLNSICGIPLTPEILESAGFEKRNSNILWTFKDDFFIEKEGAGFEILAGEYTIGETFHYLHELQNICYFLFKVELPINLNATA